jgi:hypothetical protein
MRCQQQRHKVALVDERHPTPPPRHIESSTHPTHRTLQVRHARQFLQRLEDWERSLSTPFAFPIPGTDIMVQPASTLQDGPAGLGEADVSLGGSDPNGSEGAAANAALFDGVGASTTSGAGRPLSTGQADIRGQGSILRATSSNAPGHGPAQCSSQPCTSAQGMQPRKAASTAVAGSMERPGAGGLSSAATGASGGLLVGHMAMPVRAELVECLPEIPGAPDQSGTAPCWQYLRGVDRDSKQVDFAPLGSGTAPLRQSHSHVSVSSSSRLLTDTWSCSANS